MVKMIHNEYYEETEKILDLNFELNFINEVINRIFLWNDWGLDLYQLKSTLYIMDYKFIEDKDNKIFKFYNSINKRELTIIIHELTEYKTVLSHTVKLK